MSQSDSSALSSPPSTDDETIAKAVDNSVGLKKWFKPAPKVVVQKAPSSPPLPKRAASPRHEYVLADNEDIAVSPYSLQAIRLDLRAFWRVEGCFARG